MECAGLEAKLERLMASKGSSFEKEVAYRASQAAGGHIRLGWASQQAQAHALGHCMLPARCRKRLVCNKSFAQLYDNDTFPACTHPGPLAVWVVANLHYSRVLKQIAPLEGQLNQLKGELAESQGRLQQCQDELLALDEQVCAWVWVLFAAHVAVCAPIA
jgi:hypothetical protein